TFFWNLLHFSLRRTGRLSLWILRSRLVRLVGIVSLCFVIVLFWNVPRTQTSLHYPLSSLTQMQKLERAIDEHNAWEQRLKQVLVPPAPPPGPIIPVLVIACNRPSVKRTVDALLKHRSNVLHLSPSQFPITVSQGCESQPTADVLAAYGDVISLIKFNYQSREPPNKRSKLTSYQSMTQHYKFALDYMLFQKNHSALIVVEDDLDIAPDFFEYFAATLPLLHKDPTLFCVSAWNDNGRPNLIDEQRNDVIYRTDFFPGLGWMLLREFWLEIRDRWPDIYWDEYLRQAYIRRDRACLRPEVGRTTTFGRDGTSLGQYFDKYLKTMRLNSEKFDFINADLTYLLEPVYTRRWKSMVYEQSVAVPLDDLLKDRLPESDASVLVIYTKPEEFSTIAGHLTLMPDLKSGVSRTAFRGVVPVFWKKRQLFIAPPTDWSGYVLS
ncbi:hypothetical protein T265_13020, partial [Opisthorchis viverrini]